MDVPLTSALVGHDTVVILFVAAVVIIVGTCEGGNRKNINRLRYLFYGQTKKLKWWLFFKMKAPRGTVMKSKSGRQMLPLSKMSLRRPRPDNLTTLEERTRAQPPSMALLVFSHDVLLTLQ